jgi:hypothetical protein
MDLRFKMYQRGRCATLTFRPTLAVPAAGVGLRAVVRQVAIGHGPAVPGSDDGPALRRVGYFATQPVPVTPPDSFT